MTDNKRFILCELSQERFRSTYFAFFKPQLIRALLCFSVGKLNNSVTYIEQCLLSRRETVSDLNLQARTAYKNMLELISSDSVQMMGRSHVGF